MDVEYVVEEKGSGRPGVKHAQLLPPDPELQALIEKNKEYDTKLTIRERIDDNDVHQLIRKYAFDLDHCDEMTFCEVFHISPESCRKLLHCAEFRQEWETAKKVRGSIANEQGRKVAKEAYDIAVEEYRDDNRQFNPKVRDLVNAAKTYANYNQMYAMSLNPALNPRNKFAEQKGDVKIVLNTGIKLSI